jgi:hypothetical protein
MLADFFGNVLIEPVEVPHTRSGFRAAVERLRQAVHDHRLDDLVVAVERSVPVFTSTGWGRCWFLLSAPLGSASVQAGPRCRSGRAP